MKDLGITFVLNEKISQAQLVGLFVLANKHNKNSDDVAEIALSLGYKSRKDILQKDIKIIEERLMDGSKDR